MAADSPVFEWTSAALERATNFNSLQARGTVRLALKKAGLDATTVNVIGMTAVLGKLMPKELASRKIENGDTICTQLVAELKAANFATAPAVAEDQKTPEDVFRRMFGERPAGAGPRKAP
jgi:hypothetical protein